MPSVYVSGLGYSTSSPILIPGKIEAEAFINSGGNFEIKPTSDDGGSGKISGISAGSWLEYPVNVTQSSKYDMTARIATPAPSNTKFIVMLDGVTIATFYPIDTGSWDTFADLTIPNISFTQGSHTIKIMLTTGSFDLNYLKLSLH